MGFEPTVDSRPQRFSSSMEFVLSGPSGVIQCCPVQRFVLSSPSGVVLCYPVLPTTCLQTEEAPCVWTPSILLFISYLLGNVTHHVVPSRPAGQVLRVEHRSGSGPHQPWRIDYERIRSTRVIGPGIENGRPYQSVLELVGSGPACRGCRIPGEYPHLSAVCRDEINLQAHFEWTVRRRRLELYRPW